MVFECIVCMESLEDEAPPTHVAAPGQEEINNNANEPGPSRGRKSTKKPSAPEDLTHICATACGHMFHRACLNRWFKQKEKIKKECPACRKLLTPGKIIHLYPPGSADPEESTPNSNQTVHFHLSELEERSLPSCKCGTDECDQLFDIHKTLVSDYNKLIERLTEEVDDKTVQVARVLSLEEEIARLRIIQGAEDSVDSEPIGSVLPGSGVPDQPLPVAHSSNSVPRLEARNSNTSSSANNTSHLERKLAQTKKPANQTENLGTNGSEVRNNQNRNTNVSRGPECRIQQVPLVNLSSNSSSTSDFNTIVLSNTSSVSICPAHGSSSSANNGSLTRLSNNCVRELDRRSSTYSLSGDSIIQTPVASPQTPIKRISSSKTISDVISAVVSASTQEPSEHSFLIPRVPPFVRNENSNVSPRANDANRTSSSPSSVSQNSGRTTTDNSPRSRKTPRKSPVKTNRGKSLARKSTTRAPRNQRITINTVTERLQNPVELPTQSPANLLSAMPNAEEPCNSCEPINETPESSVNVIRISATNSRPQYSTNPRVYSIPGRTRQVAIKSTSKPPRSSQNYFPRCESSLTSTVLNLNRLFPTDHLVRISRFTESPAMMAARIARNRIAVDVLLSQARPQLSASPSSIAATTTTSTTTTSNSSSTLSAHQANPVSRRNGLSVNPVSEMPANAHRIATFNGNTEALPAENSHVRSVPEVPARLLYSKTKMPSLEHNAQSEARIPSSSSSSSTFVTPRNLREVYELMSSELPTRVSNSVRVANGTETSVVNSSEQPVANALDLPGNSGQSSTSSSSSSEDLLSRDIQTFVERKRSRRLQNSPCRSSAWVLDFSSESDSDDEDYQPCRKKPRKKGCQ